MPRWRGPLSACLAARKDSSYKWTGQGIYSVSMHHLAEKLNLLRGAVCLQQEAEDRDRENTQFLDGNKLSDYLIQNLLKPECC